jgi:hypothetical protein
MRRVFWLALVLCLAAAVAVAQYGTSPKDKSAAAARPDFDMTASYIEACSCDMFCPCYYNTRSTLHDGKQFCKANLVLKVDKGNYKGVKLDGAKVWLAVDLGSDWSTGKDSWAVVNFDPSDTKEQQAALGDIIGQLYPVKWQKMAADTVPFTWNVDTKTGVAEARMENGKGEVVLERVGGNDSKQEVVVRNLPYWGAQSNDGFRMWKTKHEYYEGHGEKTDFSGTNGFLITIHFSGKAKSASAD